MFLQLGELDKREHREFYCLLCSPLVAPMAPSAQKVLAKAVLDVESPELGEIRPGAKMALCESFPFRFPTNNISYDLDQ